MSDFAVFDTNVLIDFSREDPVAAKAIKSYTVRLVSMITWIEFMTGIPEYKEPTARRFLKDTFEVIYPDEGIVERTLLNRKKYGLKFPDAMIYATANAYNGVLVTRDIKDFKPEWGDIVVPQ